MKILMQDSIRVGQIARGYYGQIARGYYEDLPKRQWTGNKIQRQIGLECYNKQTEDRRRVTKDMEHRVKKVTFKRKG